MRSARIRVTALALVVAAGVLGAARLPNELADQHTAAAAAVERVPVRDGLARPPGIGVEQDRFLRFARDLVPADAAVRIVLRPGERSSFDRRATGTPGVCGYATVAPGAYFWVVYALSPRPSVCDADAEWTVYFGVPAPPPTGSARLYPFAAGYAVVRR